MIRPTLRQLEYLTAIQEHKNFSAAANACNVTQSTLSAGIKELESILSQTLVNRTRSAATLTPFGLETFETAQEILSQTDRLTARAKSLKEPMSGPLRLGIIPTIAPYTLPEILPRLTKQFPKLEIQLFEDLTDNLLEKLNKNQIDIALLAYPYDTPGMHQHILFEEPFYAAMPEGLKEQNTININELEPDKLLLLEDGHCLRDHALRACDLQIPKQRKTFSATSLPTILQMVREGLGTTLLPEMACRPDTVPKGIKLLPFNDATPPTRQIGLSWRKNDPRRKDYTTLAEFL
ncbi:MAG: hydrogen peroxide-inducible genes activator [Alphaproteobacteria bacterium]